MSRPWVRYASNKAFWTSIPGARDIPARELWNQHEVLLFARDPEEMYRRHYDFVTQMDFKNPSFNQRWRDEWRPSPMPFTADLWYPPQANWPTEPNGSDVMGQPLPATKVRTFDFWGNNVPTGPGSLPNNFGSVKAASVVDHGICGKFIPYVSGGLGLLERIDSLVFPAFIAEACPSEAFKRFANYAPFLHVTSDREPSVHGGFFFNMSLQLNVLFGGGPNLLVHDASELRLFDGRLTVEPKIVFGAGDGTGADAVRLLLDRAFGAGMTAPLRANDIARPGGLGPKTFAEGLWQAADDTQSVVLGPLLGLPGGCVQPSPGEEAVANTGSANDCGGMVNTLEGAVVNAFNTSLPTLVSMAPQLVAPPAPTIDDQNQILMTMRASEFNGRIGANAFKNFRCVDRGAGPRCEYIVRAKRLNVLPDGVELVFIDDRREYQNPTYPLWLLAWSRHLPNNPMSPLFALCDPPVARLPLIFHRTFTDLQRDCVKFTCSNGVVTSTPQQSCPL